MLNQAIRQERNLGSCSISPRLYSPALRTASRERRVHGVYFFSASGLICASAFGGLEGAEKCLEQMAGEELCGPLYRPWLARPVTAKV
jgi:hypothetical protein